MEMDGNNSKEDDKMEECKETVMYMWGYLPGISEEKSPILSPLRLCLRGDDSWRDVCGCGFALAFSESGKMITWGPADDEGQSCLRNMAQLILSLMTIYIYEAGIGIAELIALEMSKQTKTPLEETRKKIWLVDSKGLIVSSRKDSLQHFKKPWAHEHEPVNNLLHAVKAIKPTELIGSSGIGRTFTKEVIEAVASFNEIPLILALSNPTSQSECTAEEAYTWGKGLVKRETRFTSHRPPNEIMSKTEEAANCKASRN